MDKKNTQHKGLIESVYEKAEASRSRRLHAASEKVLASAAAKGKEDEEYQKQLHQEKIELLKVKQGLIDESALTAPEEKKNYTFWQKTGAFFYCNKALIAIGCFFAAIAGFLIYDFVSKPEPDFTLMILTCDDEMDKCTGKLEEIISEYADDMNGNGEILSSAYYMPLCDMREDDEKEEPSKNAVKAESTAFSDAASPAAVTEAAEHEAEPKQQDPYTQQASTSKLFALMQTGDTIMVISDSTSDIFFSPDLTLADLEEFYPGNEHVKGHGFYLSGTKFAEETGYQGEIPEDVYIGLRKVQKGSHYRDEMQKNFDEARKILDALVERFS
ncbi:hypothetical protein [Ruminococcus sp. HUN007]|uniref:hypothetical protein n=1 Tax=Ruminococcus sp. HUN007 TaxID=1514668 RepID=UPI0005D1E76F|nr:hypothetical protein [Ruminococcus sp. HUN007]